MGSLILSRSFHVGPAEGDGKEGVDSDDDFPTDDGDGDGDEEGNDDEDEDEEDASTVGMVPMAGQSEQTAL
jgi:hypothetical protein